MQNWPSNFHSFSFLFSNFQFCQFSHLTFNFYQCRIPLNPSYKLLLMSLKRHHFPFLFPLFFFIFFIFRIKREKEKSVKKKKHLRGTTTLFPFPWNQNWLHNTGRASMVTADHLWGDQKKSTSERRFSKLVVDVDDDFEFDIQDFKDDDEFNIDEGDEVLGFDFKEMGGSQSLWSTLMMISSSISKASRTMTSLILMRKMRSSFSLNFFFF